MKKSPLGSRGRVINESCDPLSLREWGVKAKMISRENTLSRRFSASHITSFREDAQSFRSNITGAISSTASSPGYSHRAEEIDPSTYSFTNALKALQARSMNCNTWECLSPDGFALNSKWNEAEKYICNPVSGEVPMECLSAKTLSGRSFRGLTNRITMSAPLIYPCHSRLFHFHTTTSIQDKSLPNKQLPRARSSITQEKKLVNITRDVGTQSTPQELTSASASPSPASTPPIQERSINCNLVQSTDSPDSSSKSKSEQEEEQVVIKGGIRQDKEEEEEEGGEKKSKRFNGGGGCLWLRNLWTCRSRSSSKKRKQREKDKPKTTNIFICHFDGSSSSSKI